MNARVKLHIYNSSIAEVSIKKRGQLNAFKNPLFYGTISFRHRFKSQADSLTVEPKSVECWVVYLKVCTVLKAQISKNAEANFK